MPNQHRQQNSGQRIRSGNQRFKDRHDRLWDQHIELRLDRQAQRIQGQNHHQHRDQQIKGVFDHRRHLVGQANANVMRLQEAHHFNTVNRHQNRGKNPRSSQAVNWHSAVCFRRGNQQEGHDREHGAHKRI